MPTPNPHSTPSRRQLIIMILVGFLIPARAWSLSRTSRTSLNASLAQARQQYHVGQGLTGREILMGTLERLEGAGLGDRILVGHAIRQILIEQRDSAGLGAVQRALVRDLEPMTDRSDPLALRLRAARTSLRTGQVRRALNQARIALTPPVAAGTQREAQGLFDDLMVLHFTTPALELARTWGRAVLIEGRPAVDAWAKRLRLSTGGPTPIQDELVELVDRVASAEHPEWLLLQGQIKLSRQAPDLESTLADWPVETFDETTATEALGLLDSMCLTGAPGSALAICQAWRTRAPAPVRGSLALLEGRYLNQLGRERESLETLLELASPGGDPFWIPAFESTAVGWAQREPGVAREIQDRIRERPGLTEVPQVRLVMGLLAHLDGRPDEAAFWLLDCPTAFASSDWTEGLGKTLLTYAAHDPTRRRDVLDRLGSVVDGDHLPSADVLRALGALADAEDRESGPVDDARFLKGLSFHAWAHRETGDPEPLQDLLAHGNLFVRGGTRCPRACTDRLQGSTCTRHGSRGTRLTRQFAQQVTRTLAERTAGHGDADATLALAMAASVTFQRDHLQTTAQDTETSSDLESLDAILDGQLGELFLPPVQPEILPGRRVFLRYYVDAPWGAYLDELSRQRGGHPLQWNTYLHNRALAFRQGPTPPRRLDRTGPTPTRRTDPVTPVTPPRVEPDDTPERDLPPTTALPPLPEVPAPPSSPPSRVPLVPPPRDPSPTPPQMARIIDVAKSMPSPILLDLNGNGRPDLTDPADARGGVVFDLAGGVPQRIQWTRAGLDGWLCHDLDGDSQISSGHELFGTADGDPNGFMKLERWDRDRDGVIRGAELEGLLVWRDVNQDGLNGPGEVTPLASRGRVAIHVPDVGVTSTWTTGDDAHACWDIFPMIFGPASPTD